MGRQILVFLLFLTVTPATALEVKSLNSVYDGDTFKVDLKCDEDIFCKDIPVRVWGIDTPEMRGNQEEREMAKRAKALTVSFLKEGFYLEDCRRDKYFRVVCKVRDYRGRKLENELISNGLGVPYFGGTKLKH